MFFTALDRKFLIFAAQLAAVHALHYCVIAILVSVAFGGIELRQLAIALLVGVTTGPLMASRYLRGELIQVMQTLAGITLAGVHGRTLEPGYDVEEGLAEVRELQREAIEATKTFYRKFPLLTVDLDREFAAFSKDTRSATNS